MTRVVLALTCVLLLANAAPAALDPFTELWWPMNDGGGVGGATLTDYSGFGRHGVVSTGNGVDPWGVVNWVATDDITTYDGGYGLNFQAVFSAYTEGWLVAHYDGGPFAAVNYQLPDTGSIAMWYKTCPEFMYNWQTIWDNSGTDASKPHDNWECGFEASAAMGWRASKDSANGGPNNDYSWPGHMAYYLTTDELGGVANDYRDTWFHITATWERFTTGPPEPDHPTDPNYASQGLMVMKLYVNGALEYTSPSGTDIDDPSIAHAYIEPGDTFYLGGGNPGNPHAMGTWDDVAIWSRMLSDDDVMQVYLNGVDSFDPLGLGDATGDGIVDAEDASMLALNWKQSGKDWGDGDFNLDGTVDERDASILASHWGNDYTLEQSAPVPEPSPLALLAAACGILLLRRKA